ncbi:hypothetical protein LCGC14_0244130 [marine sediment metagenome]|uniref:Uncharacterized protein n=1 Tax=marine sediment metagenome TaxID=412755 RepID=A0A0F9WRF9_9ZZZZ
MLQTGYTASMSVPLRNIGRLVNEISGYKWELDQPSCKVGATPHSGFGLHERIDSVAPL